MKNKTKLTYGVLNNIVFLARDIAREQPLLMVLLLLEMILSVVSPVLSLYIPKIALELVATNASVENVFLRLGGIGLVMTLSMAISGMAGKGKYMMYNGMRFSYLQKLFLQSIDCDYQLFESAEGQQKYAKAVDAVIYGDQSGISKLTVATVDIFVAIASFFLYSTILSSLNPFMAAALLLLSGINLITMKHARDYEYRHKDDTARLSRQMSYVENTANNWKWGKDIRMYGMSNWLPDIRDILLNTYTTLSYKIRKRYFAAGIANAATLFLRDSISYGYLIYAVSTGSVSLGDFVLYFGAITGFSDFIGRIIDDITQLNAANLLMNDMRAFLDHTDIPDPENPAVIPQTEKLSIEFRHVWFSYSDETEPVLKDFNIMIKPGEKIALVGVNGAGKTTITKLLCGFLKPDRGEILINGTNISQYRKDDLFSLFSVVFQDLFFLPFTVAENISMCSLDQTDLSRVEDCLKKVGLYDVITGYPNGIQSYMLKEINDGIILSGGQQQKLLMARALYKNAPILLLDEPTAALDPIAESETYENFHQHSRNKTAIYISHRLASTRFCDRIILLNHGMASEIGTHEELLKRNGEYAKMYALQSHYYQSEGGEANA